MSEATPWQTLSQVIQREGLIDPLFPAVIIGYHDYHHAYIEDSGVDEETRMEIIRRQGCPQCFNL